MSSENFLPGVMVYEAGMRHSGIILAVNPRINIGILTGIMRAAQQSNSIVIFELARSECNLERGYTGLTPSTFAENVRNAAKEVNFIDYVIHADHTTLTRGDDEDIGAAEKLLTETISAGYTSFSIDASFLFKKEAETIKDQLAENLRVTTHMAKFIQKKMGDQPFGLEVEVGEIGKTDPETGMVITTVEEAKTFIEGLKVNNVKPHLLAIANGTVHGRMFDEKGRMLEQGVSIDIPRTIEIGKAIQPYGVKIAQHGITGTPLELIATKFPKDILLKGNVGTFWMELAWDVLKVYDPALFDEIKDWVLTTYEGQGRSDLEVFTKNCKFAIKEFFDKIYKIDKETKHALEMKAYAEALLFIKAFGTTNSKSWLF